MKLLDVAETYCTSYSMNRTFTMALKTKIPKIDGQRVKKLIQYFPYISIFSTRNSYLVPWADIIYFLFVLRN